ncbi:MAG TPA: hypothetical protein VLN26_18155 [Gaiellaceae bacterium]|nr:hypothetical protein [Gaiellaceae bacterium]
MHRGPWIAIAVLLALALAGLLALGSSLSSGRPAYVRENLRIVRSLPLYPGARRFDLSTTRTDAGGWRTEAFYGTPSATPEAVWAFYAQRLPARGWTGGGAPDGDSVSWTRGRALLLVFVGAPGRYSLVVDSRAA